MFAEDGWVEYTKKKQNSRRELLVLGKVKQGIGINKEKSRDRSYYWNFRICLTFNTTIVQLNIFT